MDRLELGLRDTKVLQVVAAIAAATNRREHRVDLDLWIGRCDAPLGVKRAERTYGPPVKLHVLLGDRATPQVPRLGGRRFC
ncbi:MAG: hypothetical protein QOG40_611 [Solirubrobacteraceae bacterium]|jgi:hypothetical protein|nr:hypothetical protein [Solirubrobacteraceae bacterium]